MAPSASQPSIGDLISLKGRRAIVTGGATGLGLAIAGRFAEAGAAVVLADVDSPEATRAAADLVGRGYRASAVECDVSDDESVSRMVDATVKSAASTCWSTTPGSIRRHHWQRRPAPTSPVSSTSTSRARSCAVERRARG